MPRELKRMKLSVGPCEYCKEDETMEMVQCDNCDKWFHYHCVHVGPEIKYLDWSCYVCKNLKEVRETTKVFQVKMSLTGRHENCEKPTLPKPKINYLASQSKKNGDKRQFEEGVKDLADLKIEIISKNKRIDEQGKQIEEGLNNMADLKIQIQSKDDRIDEQGKQIQEGLHNLADLKIQIQSKDDRIDEQGKQIQEGLHNLADLKIQIQSKDDRINEQRDLIEAQRKQIVELKSKIVSKDDRIDDLEIVQYKKPDQLQGKYVKDVVNVEKEVVPWKEEDILGFFLNLMCDTEEELLEFNKKLINPYLLRGLQDQFCIFGGDVKTFIIGMINRIMSKKLQSELSWSGKRTTKPGFADMTNITALIHFCCAKKFKKYDSKAGDQIIQKLLQAA